MPNENESKNKVIIVLVEGYSDKDSFDNYLNKLVTSKNISFGVYHGDLFSDYEKAEKTLDDIIVEEVDKVMQENLYRPEDILMIVQLADTDGVFAPDDIVKQNSSFTEETQVKYNPNVIEVYDVQKMIRTRAFKRERIHDAIHKKEIVYKGFKIPYEIYYMSCNLECALYNCYENKTDDEKRTLADEFSNKYVGDINGFMSFMNSLNKSNTMEHLASWAYIEQDSRSLLQASNFIIFLEKLRKSL